MAIDVEILELSSFINPLLAKRSITNSEFENFRTYLTNYINDIKQQHEAQQSEPNIVSNALKPFVESFGYKTHAYSQKGQSGIDLAIMKGTLPSVIFELKKYQDKDMITKSDFYKKSFYEAIFYFMRERDGGNTQIYHIVISDFYNWFVFDAKEFERLFWNDKEFKKIYDNYSNPNSLLSKTGDVYSEIGKLLFEKKSTDNLFEGLKTKCAYVNLKEPLTQKNLLTLYKLLSPDHLLKEFNPNDANSLNKAFYSEFLYILGLEEIKQGGKKVIVQSTKPQEGSLYENLKNKLNHYGKDDSHEAIVSLLIVWINRILFLKLLESQIVQFNGNNKDLKFLTIDKINDFDGLESLFFDVLAKPQHTRQNKPFDYVPYLNSSLFERHPLEENNLYIANLQDDLLVSYFPQTLLKNELGHKKAGDVSTLHYLFEFLDAYNFSSEGVEEVVTDNKTLINASVLGLIFEKLNGYKDGSFYTPSFITMYMARESITKAILSKFKERYEIDVQNLTDLNKALIRHNISIEETNTIVNSLTICDPAVGSGHFLVSCLNELIYTKYCLGLFEFRNLSVEIENDELFIKHFGDFHTYTKPKDFQDPQHKLQKTLFEEKRRIIENQLFGVDINPNSVNITRLRLWIELLKHTYYKEDGTLETLPNIDINIKCGNSLISRYDLTDELKIKNITHEIENYKQTVQNYKANLGTKQEILKSIESLKDKFKLTLKAEWKLTKTLTDKLKAYVSEYGNDDLDDDLLIMAVKNRYGMTPSLFGDTPDPKKKTKLLKELSELQAKCDEIESGKIYDDAFEWRFEFPEVLDENGNFVGFDIVIGNPPYGAELSNEHKDIFKVLFENVHMRTPDTFNYFISKCLNIIKENGRLSFIIPNNLLFQNEFEKTRELLLCQTLNKVINLGDGVFEDASVPTAIIELLKQNTSHYTFDYLDVRNDESKDIVTSHFKQIGNDKILKVPSFVFGVDVKSIEIIEKVKAKSYLIDDIALEVASGISTGGDKIFRVDESTIDSHTLENDILFDCLVGREINRYEINSTAHKLIYTVKNVQIDGLPNIKSYLEPFKEKLSSKRETKNGTLPWWCLHWARYKELFTEPKILLRQTADSVIATFDEDGFFVLNSILVFQIDKKFEIGYKFALAILNTKLTNFIYQNLTQEEGRGFAEVKPKNIRKLFIPKLDQKAQKPFIDIVDKILELKKSGSDTIDLEKQIDMMVYELYGLSEDEIKIIGEL